MVLAAVVTLISGVVASFLGYWIHRGLHRAWSGPFHRAHMEHHQVLYPPSALTSDSYREASWHHRGVFLFTPAFLAIVSSMGLVAWATHVPGWCVALSAGVILAFGLLNDWVHDTFHLRRHWLQRYPAYRRARRIHFVHHVDMRRSYGIVSHEWDRAFRTALPRRDS